MRAIIAALDKVVVLQCLQCLQLSLNNRWSIRLEFPTELMRGPRPFDHIQSSTSLQILSMNCNPGCDRRKKY